MKKHRNNFFDSIKGLLILLVIFGHAIEPLISENHFLFAFFLFIYSFHMPLLVFISGYFSKKSVYKNGQGKTILKYLIIYLLFQLLYVLFEGFVLCNGFDFRIWRPFWIMWYLFSLIIWRLFLPFVKKIPYNIFVFIVLGIIAGYITEIDRDFSLSRTICFYPYFLVGYYFDGEKIKILFQRKNKLFNIIGLITLFLTYLIINPIKDQRWFFMLEAYAHLNIYDWFAGVGRLQVYLISFISSYFVLLLTPNESSFLAMLGRQSLAIYLFHGFVIRYVYSSDQLIGLIDKYPYFLIVVINICFIPLLANWLYQISKKFFLVKSNKKNRNVIAC